MTYYLAIPKELLDADLEMVPCQDTRYTFYSTRSTYGEIEQIWVVFQSQPMKKRMEKTFDKKLKKEAKTAQRSLGRLRRREFACEADAKKEAELWIADHPYFRFTDLTVEPVFRRAGKKRGRPKKDEVLLTVYTIKTEIELDAEIVLEARDKLGRFILTSSDTEIDPEVLLQYYKGQQSVERGFRFLKDKWKGSTHRVHFFKCSIGSTHRVQL